jgi:hypothetical protein
MQLLLWRPYPAQANLAKDRVDRRLAKHQTGKRRVVVRERAARTLALFHETEAEGVEIVKQRVAANAVVHADEASHWVALQRPTSTQCASTTRSPIA